MTLPSTFKNFFGLRRYTTLPRIKTLIILPIALSLSQGLLIPGALNAMEETTQIPTPQTLLLPRLKVVMKLFNPSDSPDEFWTKRACYANPNRDGLYDINQISIFDHKGNHVPLLTSVQIDPANPAVPIITYRFTDISAITSKNAKDRAYEASDFQLSVPYEKPRLLDVQLENQTLNLEITVEKKELAAVAQ
jgi:hypothetical protein